MNNKINFFWILPFCFFIIGYFCISFFFQKKEQTVPNIIGKSLQESIAVLSQNKLCLRLLNEIEDINLDEGTVLNQIPRAGQKIKSNKYIFVVLSKKPKALVTPNLTDLDTKTVKLNLTRLALKPQIYWLKSNVRLNKCIAQSPSFGEELDRKKIITYFSAGKNSLYLVPDFKNCPVSQLKEILTKEDIKFDLIHTNQDNSTNSIDQIDLTCNCQNCKVIDQKPMAGSIVNLDKKLYMQFQVQN